MAVGEYRWGASVAATLAAAAVMAACGGSGSTTLAPATVAPQVTTTTALQGQVGGGSPAPKPSTTTTTSMAPVAQTLPDRFPADLSVPEGRIEYFTGNPQLGFRVDLQTDMSFSELVRFFTDGLDGNRDWSISVRDIGQGFLAGFEGLWATYTATDHVVTQLNGLHQGVIEIEGGDVSLLLDGLIQPTAGEEPGALPSKEELPRPDTELLEAKYSSGIVQTAYGGGPSVFVELIAAYRHLQWVELGATEPLEAGGAAVGELGNWRVTIRDSGASVEIDFEDLLLSFP